MEISDALDRWNDVAPPVDIETMEIFIRLGRFSSVAKQEIDHAHKDANLAAGEFDVLATMMQLGTATPGDLAKSLSLSKAGISGRLQRLKEKGLITEAKDSNDGRGKVISISRAGRSLILDAVHPHIAAEKQALQPLNADEQLQLLTLLRKLT